MFKIGDRVKRLDGRAFSNGDQVVTVHTVEGDKIWFKESSTWLTAHYIVLVEEPMNNGVIELNGKKYKVEVIEGKGECLVPVRPTYGDLIGKVVQLPDKSLHLIQRLGVNRAVRVWLTGVSGVDTYDCSQPIQFETVVADSLSEAIQKGLVK